MAKKYDNTDRAAFFPTMSENPEAPAYRGIVEMSVETIKASKLENGNYKVSVTLWAVKGDVLNGVVISNDEAEEARAEYLAKKEKLEKAKSKAKTKPIKPNKRTPPVEELDGIDADELEDDIPF